MALIGGKLLGEGVYGCAFQPALACASTGQATPNTIGKVGKVTAKGDAEIESSVSDRLRKFSNADSYFILVESQCQPAPRTAQTEPDLEKCGALQNVKLPSLSQLTMPFGGKPLPTIAMRVQNINLPSFLTHILEAGTLLAMAKIVHFDLHRNNLLLSQKDKPRIIDFGLAWSPAELTRSNLGGVVYKQYNPKITQEPPEVTVINGLLSGKQTEDCINQIFYEKTPLRFYGRLFGLSESVLKKVLREFVATSWAFEKQDWYTFYTLYWSKMDAWAMGAMGLQLMEGLMYDPQFERSPAVERVLRGLCWCDPGERYDCVEALAELAPNSEILRRPDVLAWLQKVRGHREKLQKIIQGLDS